MGGYDNPANWYTDPHGISSAPQNINNDLYLSGYYPLTPPLSPHPFGHIRPTNPPLDFPSTYQQPRQQHSNYITPYSQYSCPPSPRNQNIYSSSYKTTERDVFSNLDYLDRFGVPMAYNDGNGRYQDEFLNQYQEMGYPYHQYADNDVDRHSNHKFL
jgi:hypothetical protein